VDIKNLTLGETAVVDPKVEHFKKRTNEHLRLVRKWSDLIRDKNYRGVDAEKLDEEKRVHDEGKWVDPEFTPYVHLTWKYKNPDYKCPMDTSAATFHHIKNHRHHPEYWDDNVGPEVVNPKNRDKPSGFMVDAKSMPLTYVAAMMADWLAMSEEKGTNVKDWADNNVNKRWSFTPEQKSLIYKIVMDFGDKT